MKKDVSKILIIPLLSMMFLVVASNATAQEYKKVTPEKGEGIFGMLRRYNLEPNDYFDAFIELNKKNLGDDLQLKTGQNYLLPIQIEDAQGNPIESGAFPIFGPKYERVEFKDSDLQGAVFYIVPGHGGPDPGAMGRSGGHVLCEDEYAYDIGLRLARNLLEHNATVYIITRDPDDGIRDDRYLKCDKDEYCWPNDAIPLNQTQRLKQRVDAINVLAKKYRGQYQRTVELHVDSRYEEHNVDIFFYHHPNSKRGEALNNTLFATIKEMYERHQPGRGYKGSISGRRLYMLRHADPVSTYIELGNINHPRDQKRLLEVSNRQAIANWLTLGLLKDYTNSKK